MEGSIKTSLKETRCDVVNRILLAPARAPVAGHCERDNETEQWTVFCILS